MKKGVGDMRNYKRKEEGLDRTPVETVEGLVKRKVPGNR